MDDEPYTRTFVLFSSSGGKSFQQKLSKVGKAGRGGCGSDSVTPPTSVSVDNLTSTELQ